MEECFASSDEGVTTLERYNRAAQEKRAKEKAKLVSAKAAAAERVSAQAVKKAKLAAALLPKTSPKSRAPKKKPQKNVFKTTRKTAYSSWAPLCALSGLPTVRGLMAK